MRMDDQQIIDAFVKNRRDGIRALFERYYRPLVIYASNLIHDDTMAEDLVQEFFVRLWEDNYLEHVTLHLRPQKGCLAEKSGLYRS